MQKSTVTGVEMIKEKNKVSFVKGKLSNSVCSDCGAVTGVIQVVEQKLFQPSELKQYCSHCNPSLHNAQ